MTNNILLGQYVESDSIWHRLDPRVKLLSTMLIMLSFMLLHSLTGYVLAVLFVLAVLVSTRIPLRMYWRGLRPISLILAFTFLYHAFTADGTIIWSWSFIHVTVEGLQNGAWFVLRIILLIQLASVLTLTTKPLSLAQGLDRLLSPFSRFHLPVEQFSLMIAIAIRFIPTIGQELERIIQAQQARGYDIHTVKPPRRFFAYIPILVPLIFATVQRAEQLTLAIDARAYGKGKGRTTYRQLRLTRLDYCAGGLAIAFAAVLMVL